MKLIVHPDQRAEWNNRIMRCAVGRSGFSANKQEGDGTTPTGAFPFREVLYRADRIGPPPTGLPCRAIRQGDGWCDDIKDPLYNRPVALPYKASHETLTRADGLYDLLVVIGHNDDPIVSGAGSAIFLHVAAPGYEPTEGCVALSLDDLRAVVAELLPNDPIEILMEND